MEAPAPLPPDVLAALPPAVVALIQWQAEQIARLTARVAELQAQLAKNSTNSSKPPSASHPHDKPVVVKPKSNRKRGAQPGHIKHQRALIPTEQCQQVVPCVPTACRGCVPTACRGCGQPLSGTDARPLRHQVWELPDLKPLVSEYQQHRLVCVCGQSTCGQLPEGVPTGQAGPRLIAFSALLMACFRQSKRRAAWFLSMILNQPASAGWMVLLQNRAAAAVERAYEELAAQLPKQPVLHVDESPSKEGSAKAWVWTFVARTFTLFCCATSRAADVPKALLGEDYEGIIHCDRARMYWAFGRLQWCWAHLKRDLQSWIDSPCNTKKRLGRDLMRPTQAMFALWRKVRDDTLSRADFQKQMQAIRVEIDALFLRGYFNALTRSVCRELVQHRECLWRFVDQPGIEPTNNAAEQALRHAVIWRKLSFGTQSTSGSRFVERLLSVIETCRRQSRDIFGWLIRAVQAHFTGKLAPSLLPTV